MEVGLDFPVYGGLCSSIWRLSVPRGGRMFGRFIRQSRASASMASFLFLDYIKHFFSKMSALHCNCSFAVL